ncbi:hypothetical protein F5Y12DRAFT_794342 [Xylaria sp. FL1777]|nr:hypothetical protein F5Y12DRAFT_794342 [Xylaria sp. FL1777]
MCREAVVIYAICTCMRCHFADIFDPDHEWYYPHYGTSIVGSASDPSHTAIIVSPGDRCDTAVLDDNGWWEWCESPPEVTETRTIFAASENAPPGNRACAECNRVCYRPRDDHNNNRSPGLLDQLSVSSEEGADEEQVSEQNSNDGSGSGGDAGNHDMENLQEERLLAIHQRIYRRVMTLMGYPENTPLPQHVTVRPAGL